MKKVLFTTLVVFALSAQAEFMSKEHNWNNTPDQYKAAVKAAKAEQKLARSLGFEWRDIGKFLKTANKKYKAGDVKGALKWVEKAKTQAILGQRQAKDQANAGPRF